MLAAGTRISLKGEVGHCLVSGCGPDQVLEVLNKGENFKLDISAPFDELRVFNRDTIKP